MIRLTFSEGFEILRAMDNYSSSSSRRQFLVVCTAAGVASGFFAGALCALAATRRDEKITGEMIDAAAALTGITIPPEKREAMLSKLNEQRQAYGAIRQLHLLNDVPPAFRFDPLVPTRHLVSHSLPVNYRYRRYSFYSPLL